MTVCQITSGAWVASDLLQSSSDWLPITSQIDIYIDIVGCNALVYIHFLPRFASRLGAELCYIFIKKQFSVAVQLTSKGQIKMPCTQEALEGFRKLHQMT